MRRLVVSLLFVVGCGEKSQPDPIAPIGSATPNVATGSSGVALTPSGKPPAKTTLPLARDALAKLAAIEHAGFTRIVRKLDDNFLDLELGQTVPALRVSIVIQPCLRCVPLQIDRWRAESDALRITISPDLRERPDTTFEVASTTIGGAPAIWTYQLAWFDKDSSPVHDHAVALYFHDGVNQIRVIVAFTGIVDTRDAMLRAAGRRDLEAAAVAIADRYTQAWAI